MSDVSKLYERFKQIFTSKPLSTRDKAIRAFSNPSKEAIDYAKRT